MSDARSDLALLARAFEEFQQTSEKLERAYQDLDRELAEKNRQLALTTEYLNSILDSMSDGVIAVDQDGVITTFSQAAAHILGYAPEEALGVRFTDHFGRPFQSRDEHDFTYLAAKDGDRVHVREENAPIHDRHGKRIGQVKVFADLREIELLRAKLDRKDRLAALGEMAATVAHEIRNPLGGIRGFAALLARDLGPDDPRGRLVQKILAGTEALDRVVSELLEYTRPVQLRPRPAACADLIDAALGYLDDAAAHIAIVREVDPAARVLADPDKVRQVLLNILLNAVQVLNEDTERPLITIRTRGDDEHTTAIEIEDNGPGISPEHLEHIFQPFYTTKEKGSGLGLAVAVKIIEAHGGTLAAAQAEAGGALLTVTLPCAAPARKES